MITIERFAPIRPALCLAPSALVLVVLLALLADPPAAAAQAAQPASKATTPATAVTVGQAAPDFTLPYLVPKSGGGFETREVTLASFRGTKNVVLAFFPAAFSPG